MTAPTEHPDTPERVDPETGEVLDSDAPDNGGWDCERHCITDLRGADWAGRKLQEAEEQIALNEEMAEGEIEVLNRKMIEVRERLRQADAPFKRAADYFRNALEVYASTPEGKAEVLKGLRKKSRFLPCGVTIGWREQKGGYRWDQSKTPAENKAALLAWAKDYDARLGTSFVTDRPVLEPLNVITAHLNNHWPRQKVPGLEYVEPGEVLTVTTKGESK